MLIVKKPCGPAVVQCGEDVGCGEVVMCQGEVFKVAVASSGRRLIVCQDCGEQHEVTEILEAREKP